MPTTARQPTAKNMIAMSRQPKRSSHSLVRWLALSVKRSTEMCPRGGLAIGQKQRAGDRRSDFDQLEVTRDRLAEQRTGR